MKACYRTILYCVLLFPILCSAQATLLADINIGTGSGIATSTDFSVVEGDTMFFLATENGITYNLYRTEGTPQTTIKLTNIDAGNSYVGQWSRVNGKYIFSMYNATTVGRELYVSDGTPVGTSLLKDICPGTTSGVYSASDFSYSDGNALYFVAAANGANFDLWKTDGTTSGTIQLSTINATNTSLGHWTKLPNGKFVFSLFDGGAIYGRELFITDGTPGGTSILKDIDAGPLTAFYGATDFIKLEGNEFYFAATDNDYNYELWKSDGTAAGTIKLSNIGATTPAIGHWNSINGKFVFSSFDNSTIYGRELWVTDGTPSGTTILKDIRNGLASSLDGAADFIYNDGNILYFTATDNGTNYELWSTDGTQSNTLKVSNTGSIANTIGHWTKLNNHFIFTMNDGGSTRGREMWVTDGTFGNTQVLKDILPGTTSAFSGSGDFIVKEGNIAYFVASDNGSTYDMWRTDGTNTGTVKISNIGATNNTVSQWTALYGNYVFSMINGIYGRELYTSTGNIGGTTLLKDIFAGVGTGVNSDNYCIKANNTMFFVASADGVNYELWKSDGTSNGTNQLTVVNATNQYLGQWSQVGARHTFSLLNAIVGRELYTINTITDLQPIKQPDIVAAVRPNPTTRTLTLSISEDEKFEEVLIFDLQGKLLINESIFLKGFSEGDINIESLNPGLYLLKMTTQSGKGVTKKIEKI
ncbi:MAG TPA: T9SS type A sorting domain-containing protein [Bacteroidia bacterium]|jgi:ELWxxDGT repeat protein|nr:T9SS type A sorting domain-containing protein [Bacteroidia bacterium]